MLACPFSLSGAMATERLQALYDTDLEDEFRGSERERSDWKIGIEAEHFGVNIATCRPLPYEGDSGLLALFEELQRLEWEPTRENPEAPIVGLTRGGCSLTLEPGGQLEFSGSPFRSIGELYDEMKACMRDLHAISNRMGFRWLAFGFHPWGALDEFPSIPKQRYGLMRRYLPTRGARSLDMMYRTCTTQVNMDYSSEVDAMRKLRVSMRLQPACLALFANSPWRDGTRCDALSERNLVWLDMDPDRSGLIAEIWEGLASYKDYVEWALRVPMFGIRRQGRFLPNTHQTFRDFLRDGHGDWHATPADWHNHLNSLFPEVRLKSTLEIRGADAQQGRMVPALAALWKGLLYDDNSLSFCECMSAGWGLDEVQNLRGAVAKNGLQASFRAKPVSDYLIEVLEVAKQGLERLDLRDGTSDASYLDPLRQLLEKRENPAIEILGCLPQTAPLPHEILAASPSPTDIH